MAQSQYLGQGTNTSWEKFWYVLGCIYFGAYYFAKVPMKKALSEYGLVEMTSAEKFWYVVQCILFGAGYFQKVVVKKALSEVRGPGAGYPGMPGGYQPQAIQGPPAGYGQQPAAPGYGYPQQPPSAPGYGYPTN